MSDTLARGDRARVVVPTKSDVLETRRRREAIQTSIEPYSRDLASLGTKLVAHEFPRPAQDIGASNTLKCRGFLTLCGACMHAQSESRLRNWNSFAVHSTEDCRLIQNFFSF